MLMMTVAVSDVSMDMLRARVNYMNQANELLVKGGSPMTFNCMVEEKKDNGSWVYYGWATFIPVKDITGIKCINSNVYILTDETLSGKVEHYRYVLTDMAKIAILGK